VKVQREPAKRLRLNGDSYTYLEREAEEYLSGIAKAAPKSTFQAHKSRLKSFLAWTQEQSSVESFAELASSYIVDTSTHSTSIDTVSGHVDTIANFGSYLHQDDPQLVTVEILATLGDQIGEGTSKLVEIGMKIDCWKQPECIEKTVESYIDYLRRSCYGTRTHAYVETILETKGRPGPVLGLNIADFALANEAIKIEIPDTHLVSATGLVNTRTVRISDHLKEILKEYLEYHRDSVTGQEPPLFTTSHGRAAPSTIRRSLNKGYGKIPDQIANSESEPTTTMTSLSPENVWKYAMTNIIE